MFNYIWEWLYCATMWKNKPKRIWSIPTLFRDCENCNPAQMLRLYLAQIKQIVYHIDSGSI